MVKSQKAPLVAIVGATGTGKSDAAIAVAQACNAEVVSADAYQVYRRLDIGTAKVDAASRARVPHHLIDVVDPDDVFTLARYLDQAHAALDDIWSRDRLPILAGGSGQYVSALLEGWNVPRVGPDLELRQELETVASVHGTGALITRLAELDPTAIGRLDPNNPRRLIRAIEVITRTGLPLSACQTRSPLAADVLILGLTADRETLYSRLDTRTDAMYAGGFLDEVRRLREDGYGETNPLRGGVGYKEASLYLDGELDLTEAIMRHKNANHRLVRRQAAWFKAEDPRITWLQSGPDSADACVRLVQGWLTARSLDSTSLHLDNANDSRQSAQLRGSN